MIIFMRKLHSNDTRYANTKMNTIEIPRMLQGTFMKYISEFSDKFADNTDISNYSIYMESDDTSYIYPGLGDFHWRDGENEFVIYYHEEGKALVSSIQDITYFKRLRVSHPDLQILKAFVTKALSYKKECDTQKVTIYNSTSKGYFSNYGEVYAQPLSSIYIPSELKTRVISHIDNFIASKDRYIKFGRPYKTSFLLTGVPGAGKSSFVKAIAHKYKRSIFVLSFTKNMTDENLIDLVSEMKDDSILLIEDVDSFFVDRQAQQINISFSALLNCMDGVLGKGNGLITFITANNPDRMDPALIRPGRVDSIVKFDYPRKREIKAAFDDLIGGTDNEFNEFYDSLKNVKISMSGIIDYLFRNTTTYMENINELLEQTQLFHEIVNDKSEKLYN